MDNIGEDLMIHDLPDGFIEIKNPSTNQTLTIKDKKLLALLDLLMQENRLDRFKGSIYVEGFKISRETDIVLG